MDPYEGQEGGGGFNAGGLAGSILLYDYLFFQRFDVGGIVYPATGLGSWLANKFSPGLRNFMEIRPFSDETVRTVRRITGRDFESTAERILRRRFGIKGHSLKDLANMSDEAFAKGVKQSFRPTLERFFSNAERTTIVRRAEQMTVGELSYAAGGRGGVLGTRILGAGGRFRPWGTRAGIGVFGNPFYRQARGVSALLEKEAPELAAKAGGRMLALAGVRSALSVAGWAWLLYDLGATAYHGVAAAYSADNYATITGGRVDMVENTGLAIAGDFTGGRLMTERRRALQAIGSARINARSTIGMEAAMVHS